MNKSILRLWLATDFSAAAGRAGERAAQLAEQHAALLSLLNAGERGGWIEELSSATLPPELTQRVEQARIAALQAEAQRLGCGGAEQRLLDDPLHRALVAARDKSGPLCAINAAPRSCGSRK